MRADRVSTSEEKEWSTLAFLEQVIF